MKRGSAHEFQWHKKEKEEERKESCLGTVTCISIGMLLIIEYPTLAETNIDVNVFHVTINST